jgi:hypothetical protein
MTFAEFEVTSCSPELVVATTLSIPVVLPV